MARILKCDTCNTVSPNSKGEYVANHWRTIKLQRPFNHPREPEFLICLDCIRKGIRIDDEGVYPISGEGM